MSPAIITSARANTPSAARAGSSNQLQRCVEEGLRSPGHALPAARSRMLGAQLGHDFSAVRIHNDCAAAQASRALGAAAWTWGRHIAFAQGRYAPTTPAGTALLAHELTHVAQQAHAQADTTVTLGEPDDGAEREADANAVALLRGAPLRRPSSAAAPSVRRSPGSALLDVALFVPRLFGLEYFTDEQLRDYLELIKSGTAEKSLFSDNKARACVAKEAQLGPYDLKTRTALIEDMLDGYTSGADESSIIELLRRATDRGALVAAVGRDHLWSNFSGRNRHIVEALTLTAADVQGAAGTALVDRLRQLDSDDLEAYSSAALDGEVRKLAQRAARLKKITAPVPSDASVNDQGDASFQINGIEVVARKDSTSTDPKLAGHGVTAVGIEIASGLENFDVNGEGRVVHFDPPRLRAIVYTKYDAKLDPDVKGSSGYGRGTTADDIRDGNTSLRFHESRHGADGLDYLRTHKPPEFLGSVGMSQQDFKKEIERFEQAIKDYNKRVLDNSVRNTDCAGKPATQEQLEPFGLSADACRKP